jgi:hypothetical protein
MTRRSLSSFFVLPAAFPIRARSHSAAADAYATFDSDGTAHIKRAIPVPKTIAPEAQALIKFYAPRSRLEIDGWLVRIGSGI